MGDIFDKIFQPLPFIDIVLAGRNPKKLADTLENAATAARRTALFVGDQRTSDKLIEGADALDNIAGNIKKGVEVHADYKAVVGIYTAWKDITPETISRDPQRAARAFGSLFANVGKIAEHLPPPLNAYAEFLAGFEDFFSNMQKVMDPESPHTVRGRALRRAMERDGPL